MGPSFHVSDSPQHRGPQLLTDLEPHCCRGLTWGTSCQTAQACVSVVVLGLSPVSEPQQESVELLPPTGLSSQVCCYWTNLEFSLSERFGAGNTSTFVLCQFRHT